MVTISCSKLARAKLYLTPTQANNTFSESLANSLYLFLSLQPQKSPLNEKDLWQK